MAHRIAKRTRLLIGLAVGALLMYLYDPDAGSARRRRVQSKLRSQTRRASSTSSNGEDRSGQTPHSSGTTLAGSRDLRSTVTPSPVIEGTLPIEGDVSPRPMAG